MKSYAVTLQNPTNGHKWTYFTSMVSSSADAIRQAEFNGMGCVAIYAQPIS